MHRVLILAAAGLVLAGCSSMSIPSMDMAPTPSPVTVQIDSRPSGALAAMSDGSSCKTPCSLQIVPKPGLSITYTLDKHLPHTTPLQVVEHPGPSNYLGYSATVTDLDPNPVFAELQPTTPPRRARAAAPKKKPEARAADVAPQTPTGAAVPPPASGTFPPPMR